MSYMPDLFDASPVYSGTGNHQAHLDACFQADDQAHSYSFWNQVERNDRGFWFTNDYRQCKPVGRPPKLFTCNACRARLGKVAVRTHQCSPKID